jgi:AcrR family transcriptional regulator
VINAAARLIAAEGQAALTARRVADEADTSTMSIYTHFGGMDGLRHAVRGEGFARLATHLGGVRETTDTVADLAQLGLAYFTSATSEPSLYRVMFLEPPQDLVDAEIGWETFRVLVRGVQRCLDAGRFTHVNAEDLATQLWALDHGTVTLHLAGLLEQSAAILTLGAAALQLFRGCGDDQAAARSSLAKALKRSGIQLDESARSAGPLHARQPRRTPARR